MSRRDVKTLDASLSSLTAQINKVKQVVEDDRYYEAERKRLTENVNFFANQLAELERVRANGEAYMESLRDQRAALRAERIELVNSDEVSKFLTLAQKLEAAQSGGAS